MGDYPEHDKLAAISNETQTLGEFLDVWLGEQGWTLCEWREPSGVPHWVSATTGEACGFSDTDAVENPDWTPRGFYPIHRNVQDILADYFGIDRDKLEVEKRAMLEAIRA